MMFGFRLAARQVNHLLSAALVASLTMLPAVTAMAQDAVIVITMAGEAYNGPPRFHLIADDSIIGTREVTEALDTQNGQRLRFDDSNNLPPSGRYSFKVMNIDAISRIDIEFSNNVSAGTGKQGDRNLYVLALSLSMVKRTSADTVVTIHEFRPQAFELITREAKGGEISPRYAALYDEGRLRLTRPTGGWEAILDRPKEADQKSQEAVETPVSPSQICDIAPLQLSQFEKNAVGLSQTMRNQLSEFGKALVGRSCTLRITAFAAGGPSEAFRTELSRSRAQEVANELIRLGVARGSIHTESAIGRGRRVVISVE